MERFGLSHLFADQIEGASSGIYWTLGALFLLLLFASFYVYLEADRRFKVDRLHRRLAQRFATLVGSFSGLGLAASVFSLLAVPFLAKRIWLVLAVVGLIGSSAYASYYFRRRYPLERHLHEETQRRQRYLPRPKAASRKRRRGRR